MVRGPQFEKRWHRRNGSLKLRIKLFIIFENLLNYFINSDNESSLSTFPILLTIESFARSMSLKNSVTQNFCVVGSHFWWYQFLKFLLVYWLSPTAHEEGCNWYIARPKNCQPGASTDIASTPQAILLSSCTPWTPNQTVVLAVGTLWQRIYKHHAVLSGPFCSLSHSLFL